MLFRSDDLIAAGGVGPFSAATLDKVLAGKAAGVRPYVNEIEVGLGGGCAPPDAEAMFQLIHLRFTQPRADAAAFTAMKQQAQALLANQSASPEAVFGDTLESVLNGNNPRRQPESPATLAQWNLDTSLAFYKARFADADRKSTRLNSSHVSESRMPSSA